MNNAFWTDIETSVNENIVDSIRTAPNREIRKSNKVEHANQGIMERISKTLEFPAFISRGENNKSLSIEAETQIPEITTTQPVVGKTKSQSRAVLRKIQARAKEKIVSLEKVLDAYGVIDNLKINNSEYEVHARIYNLSNHEILDEIVFSSCEFSVSDRQKLVENAVFYWYVGMERTLFGQERRVSEFRLRRVFNSNK